MVILRGQIWWANLPEPSGSEPGYRRPIIIIQANDFNRSRIETVVAVGVTSNVLLAEAPGNVLLPRKESGLPRDSVANVSQVITIDRSFLVERIRTLPSRILEEIDAGLRLVLEL
jgi:mRNA interferase MazF